MLLNRVSGPEFLWWKHRVILSGLSALFPGGSNGGRRRRPADIVARLDYLAGLGVDAIWLSPIFCSPMADFG